MKKRDKRSAGNVNETFRLLTGVMRALPDFLILGGHKCGTSSLYYYLIQHPQVLPAAVTEVHFFDGQFDKGVRWYRSRFPLLPEMYYQRKRTSKDVITGEATPYYLFYPHAPKRLAETVPRAKLIALLRNPVDRAYSQYLHNRRGKHHKANSEPLSFEDAIAKESERLRGELDKILADESYDSFAHRHYSYVQRGIYVDQLKAYEKFFDRSQILVIKSEDLFNKTIETYGEILRFLSLDPYVPKDLSARNTDRYPKDELGANHDGIYEELRSLFKPHNQRLYEYVQRDFGW